MYKLHAYFDKNGTLRTDLLPQNDILAGALSDLPTTDYLYCRNLIKIIDEVISKEIDIYDDSGEGYYFKFTINNVYLEDNFDEQQNLNVDINEFRKLLVQLSEVLDPKNIKMLKLEDYLKIIPESKRSSINYSEITHANFFLYYLLLFPDFGPIFAKHLKYFGEIADHYLMEDLIRFIADHYRKSLKGSDDVKSYHLEVVKKSIQFIEEVYVNTSNKYVKGLILNYFIHYFHKSFDPSYKKYLKIDDVYEDISSSFGPSLKSELEKYYK